MSATACVLTGLYDRPEDDPQGPHLERKTWCGRVAPESEWAFTGPTHAAHVIASGGTPDVCTGCRAALARLFALPCANCGSHGPECHPQCPAPRTRHAR